MKALGYKKRFDFQRMTKSNEWRIRARKMSDKLQSCAHPKPFSNLRSGNSRQRKCISFFDWPIHSLLFVIRWEKLSVPAGDIAPLQKRTSENNRFLWPTSLNCHFVAVEYNSLSRKLGSPPTGWKHCPTFCASCAFSRLNSFSAAPLTSSSEATRRVGFYEL